MDLAKIEEALKCSDDHLFYCAVKVELKDYLTALSEHLV